MPSETELSGADESLVHDEMAKQQAEWSFTTGADAKTFEEREDEREVVSHARPGGLDRVASEQRLPAEGIGAPDGELRQAFADALDRDEREPERGPGTRARVEDAERRDDIRC